MQLLLLLLLRCRRRSGRLLTKAAVVALPVGVSPLPELAVAASVVSVASFGHSRRRSCHRRRRRRRVCRLPRRGCGKQARLCLRLWSVESSGFDVSDKVRGRRAINIRSMLSTRVDECFY